ncbi:MAG: phosphoribosylanthranilate isomerase [Gammaproteobacteria bacterium]
MRHRTRVKYCGITRLRDAQIAVSLGVDALGFIFYSKSPRNVAAECAAEIIAQLPPFVTAVGLVVDMPAIDVNELVTRTNIDLVQCHGDETVSECESLNRPYLKAIRVASNSDVSALAAQYPSARGILLDAYVRGTPGGSGRRFDWRKAQGVDPDSLVIAGGLDADNVGDVIEQLRPYGVDVSSGIESAPGIKDEQKMIDFIQKVRLADGKY